MNHCPCPGDPGDGDHGLWIGLLLGRAGLVVDLHAGVALQLTRDGQRLAIQSSSDFPDRLPAFMKAGNRTPFLDRKLCVRSHSNTGLRCCTSFVSSGLARRACRRASGSRRRNLPGTPEALTFPPADCRLRPRPEGARCRAAAWSERSRRRREAPHPLKEELPSPQPIFVAIAEQPRRRSPHR